MVKSWQRLTLVLGLAVMVSIFVQACGQTSGISETAKTIVSVDDARVTEPISLQVFVEDHGRITSIGLASDSGRFIYNELGNLQKVVYDNGYMDVYNYNDNNRIIEVTRENAAGTVEDVFVFDFTAEYATRWDVVSDEVTELDFNMDESFYDRLVIAVFEPSKNSTVAASVIEKNYRQLATGNCVCQYGNAASCEGGHGTNYSCTRQGGCGNNNPCVWRGGMAE